MLPTHGVSVGGDQKRQPPDMHSEHGAVLTIKGEHFSGILHGASNLNGHTFSTYLSQPYITQVKVTLCTDSSTISHTVSM
jgi:hypothetical protein